MTQATVQRTDTSYVPDSFESLFKHYRPYIITLLESRGIHQHNSEDVANALLEKVFSKDLLGQFDPARKVRFGSFLSAFVLGYVMRIREDQQRLAERELQVVDSLVPMGSDTLVVPWLDARGFDSIDDTSYVEEQELAAMIRARLRLAAPINSQDRCDLLALFDSVRHRTLVGEKVVVQSLVEEFGVSKTTIQNWLRRLRIEVSAVVGDGA